MVETIAMFRGPWFFLSNMYPCTIILGNVRYSCAEAAFQAVKLEDKKARVRFQDVDGKTAKQMGRSVNLRSDWNEIRVDVMRWIVHEKFKQNPELAKKLLATRDCLLEEGNTWNDTFWGVCNGKGKNWLGMILMEERSKIQMVRILL